MQKYKMLKSLPWMPEGLEFWIKEGTICYEIRKENHFVMTTCLADCYRATVDYYTNEDGEFEPDEVFIAKL